jgi:hypothetical protein
MKMIASRGFRMLVAMALLVTSLWGAIRSGDFWYWSTVVVSLVMLVLVWKEKRES